MIRHNVRIRLAQIDPAAARAAIAAHNRTQPYAGDEFIVRAQTGATHRSIEIDGDAVGVAGYDEQTVSLLTLTRAAHRYDRQTLEIVLAESGAREAVVASWDHHHVDLFGAFATTIESQAYQFELHSPADLATPLPGLTLTRATEADLPYLEGPEFQSTYVHYLDDDRLRIARLDGSEIGIGALEHPGIDESKICIGVYTNQNARRQGIGRSILTLLARELIEQTKTPVSGCWWRNWESRAAIEGAGLTCVGTIFRIQMDSQRFT